MDISDCGILVVKDLQVAKTSVPGIVCMNIINCCRQLVHVECEGRLDSDCRKLLSCKVEKTRMARLSGKETIHVPAASVVAIMVRGWTVKTNNESPWLLEHGNTPFPGGIEVMPTQVNSHRHQVPVQLVKLSQEDVWLQPSLLDLSTLLSKRDLGVTAEQQAELRMLLAKYADVLAVGDDDLVTISTLRKSDTISISLIMFL